MDTECSDEPSSHEGVGDDILPGSDLTPDFQPC